MTSDFDEYRTIRADAQIELTVSNSTFVGYATPVHDISEAESSIDRFTQTHSDATHHVPAYRIREPGTGFLREWSSDDGEPTGSAGKPVLNVLDRESLENILVVVVRYFGGTKLGIGGLARAYSTAAKRAIDSAGIVHTYPRVSVKVTVGYDHSDAVNRVLKDNAVSVSATYEEHVTFTARIQTKDVDAVTDRIRSITSNDATIDLPESHST